MFFFFQAEDGIRDLVRSRGLGDVYKRQILEYLNGQLMTHTAGQVFVTAFLAMIDLDAHTLVYSNAGHNPPVMRMPDSAVTELEHSGDIPLGILANWTYTERTLGIERDTVLWLYTDGVVETRSAEGEAFGEQRLHDAIPVSYTHLRAHETVLDLVCRLLLEKKKHIVKPTTHH